MDTDNPFALTYLTEASLTPHELLDRYSFKPLHYLHERLATNANVFLVGLRGVGKTMLLKIFEPEMMALLYRSPQPEHIEARRLLPVATVSIYLNLASADARLNLFQGQDRKNTWWFKAYSDYLNTMFLERALNAIEEMSEVSPWFEASKARPQAGGRIV